jgi:hypothetical protein
MSRNKKKVDNIKNFSFFIHAKDNKFTKCSMRELLISIFEGLGIIEGLEDYVELGIISPHIDFEPSQEEQPKIVEEDELKKVLSCDLVMKLLNGKKVDTPPQKTKRRGRTRITRLFGSLSDNRVCELFSKIRKKISHGIKMVFDALVSFSVVFLSDISDLLRVDPYGKINHYHEMLTKHFTDLRIPTVRTIQKNFVWFHTKMGNLIKDYERRKKEMWNDLYEKIKRLLLMEPDIQQAVCGLD